MSDFMNKVKAAHSLLWIETHEEERALVELVSEAEREGFKTFTWDIARGQSSIYMDKGQLVYGGPVPGTDNNPPHPLIWFNKPATVDGKGGPGEKSIMFLKDFHVYIDPKTFPTADLVIRMIRNSLPILRSECKCLVILSPVVVIPKELDKEIRVINYKLPTRTELKKVLLEICASAEIPPARMPSQALEEELVNAASGMTSVEACNAFSVSLSEGGELDPEIIRREKSDIVRKSQILEVVDVNVTMDDVGGLENLKKDLMIRRENFSIAAHNYGVRSPKGIVFVGVPGCGKSLVAKATADAFKMPLLRLDMGKVFGKYVGESEGNMVDVLRIAEAVAPCCLWIDEIEKDFAGNKADTGGQEAHETSKKVFKMLLTFLQERTSDVFLVATANSVKSLPPELLRSGRVDKLYWVDLPDSIQREEILKIHLRKIGRRPDMFKTDMTKLVALCDQFSGADIEQWVQEALNLAYATKHADLTTQDFIDTVGEIVPTSKLMGNEIAINRQWAKDHGCKLASPERAKAEVVRPGKGRKIEVAGASAPENN